jgi:tRNA threonylcarbamoyl adenosine modification protein YeaZ
MGFTGMDINYQLFLALDTAFDQGRVIIFDQNGDIKSEQVLVGKMSHGAQICGAIEQSLLAINNQPLSAVMVGLGPGSFVGLRIALATALGYSFARTLPLMGFCSHRALAYSHLASNKNLAIVTKFAQESGFLKEIEPSTVIDKNDISFQLSSDFLIISDLNSNLSATGMAQACLDKITISNIVDESISIKPNYIKNPNVSLPKNSPIVGHLLP